MTIDPDVPRLDEEALQALLDRGDDAIVMFYADWCGFCRAFTPTFEDRADDLPLPAAAANITKESDPRWAEHEIDAVPTLVAFKDGEEVARVGGRPGAGLKGEDLDRLVEKLS